MLFCFEMISADGFFEGEDHDLGWQQVDQQFTDFSYNQLSSIQAIIYGRRTYQKMSVFWSTEQAKLLDPHTAKLMNELPKIVFSHSLEDSAWNNTKIVKSDPINEIKRLKQQYEHIAIFGSSNLCTSLIPANVIDEYRLMINPILLGHGTPLFHGLEQPLKLSLEQLRQFDNGNMLGIYQAEA